MKRLSIIVPVYNVEKYLAICLESLVCQDLSAEEYEIIVVIDGGTDGSLKIANSYANEYNQIRVYEQSNAGAGDARNAGMSYATGKYIQFVDSDDFLEPHVLRPLLDKIEKEGLDILRFNYQNVNERYEVFLPSKGSKRFVDYHDVITDGTTFLIDRLGYACYVWQFIFRSELILKKGNLFRKGIYFEDTEWIPRILIQAKKITSVNTIIYNYLLRKGSITQYVTKEKKRKLIDDKIYVIEALQKQMQEEKDKRWYKGMIANVMISVLGDITTSFNDEYSSVVSEFKKKQLFPLYSYCLTPSQKLQLLIINKSPRLYGFIKNIISS